VSLFDWLLISHLIGDFLVQTDNMAKNKAQSWYWMFRHIAVYMFTVTVVVVVYALNHRAPAWLTVGSWLFIFVTHIILDRRKFTLWWMRSVGVSQDHPWLSIVVDQVFHLLTLAITAQILVSASG
jgi:hypothetical protein